MNSLDSFTNNMETVTPVIFVKYIFFGLMAMFGGIVHALISLRRGETKNKWDFLALSLISGFCGVMWSLLALIYFPENIFIVAFASGMGGYMSVEGLAIVIVYLKNKFTK